MDKVLQTQSYSYLPNEAKNYIRQVYEKTGTVINTEKNKEYNTPYLNPKYVDYLSLSESEKKHVQVIPNVYKVDFLYSDNEEYSNLPTYYDLRNVNGDSYITPLKNQGNLGLCWAFATLEQAESYLMTQKKEAYSKDAEQFSVRQLDYALSTNGIDNYNNEFGYRELTGGGNFLMASKVMSYGLSLYDNSYMPYNEKNEKKQLSDVLNFAFSKYEVNSTIEFPGITFTGQNDPYYPNCDVEEDFETCYDNVAAEIKQLYINEIKKGIIDYGGAYVGAFSPDSSCGFENIDGLKALDVSDRCVDENDAHAMQIIGWDDNYQYSFCDYFHYNGNVENDSCPNGGQKTDGKGAFIVRNSWGEDPEYGFIYMTYDSINDGRYSVDVNLITSVEETSNRSWDNVYPDQLAGEETYLFTSSEIRNLSKLSNGSEKIEKIKFNSLISNAEYKLAIRSGNRLVYQGMIETELPGLYTIDLSEENIIIDDTNFKVALNGKIDDKEYVFLYKSLAVFTSNVDSDVVILTDDLETDSRVFNVYSKTKNIASNERINYSLFKGEEELKDYLDVEYNIVAKNDVNTHISITKKLSQGTYILKTEYEGNVFESNLIINSDLLLEGLGTLEMPYYIYNEEDLRQIANHLNSFFELKNDIVLTEDWVPIGTEENPFTGGFNGAGYTISNIIINSEETSSVGLFGYVNSSLEHNSYIKNVIIKDAQISSNGNTGALIGDLLISKSNIYSKTSLNIEDIFIIGGSISGTNVGALVANISGVNYSGTSVKIEKIFSSAHLTSTLSAGLVGNSTYQGDDIVISKVENIGINDCRNEQCYTHSGSIIGRYSYGLLIDNFISTGYSKYENMIYNYPIGGFVVSGIQHGYILKGRSNQMVINNLENGVYTVESLEELKDINHYSLWDDFNNNWVINEIDSITRIPLLNGVSIDYTKIDDITIDVGETKTLLDFISPNADINRLEYRLNDYEDNILAYWSNNTLYIEGLKAGITTINVTNNYDGYNKDITVRVGGAISVTYNANGGEGAMKQQIIVAESNTKLMSNTFSKTGYIFKEWNTAADGNGVSYINEQEVMTSEDLVLYAIWEPITYTIEYNSNNGSNDRFTNHARYNENIQIAKNVYYYSGYSFKEWNTDASGRGKSYQEDEEVVNLATVNNETVVLYAIWQESLDYQLNNYVIDSTNTYIKDIPVNTLLNTFTSYFTLGYGYGIDVEYKTINNKQVLYTGGKTKITKGLQIYKEFTNVVSGDPSGDGQITYLDYVMVYNHIQKAKHPNLNKKLLTGPYLLAGDMSKNGDISYLDYVKIYKSIKGEN